MDGWLGRLIFGCLKYCCSKSENHCLLNSGNKMFIFVLNDVRMTERY